MQTDGRRAERTADIRDDANTPRPNFVGKGLL